MKILKSLKSLTISALLLMSAGLVATQAHASIFLLGTDDVALHADLSFNNAFINALGAGDTSKSVLFLNNSSITSINYTGPRTLDFKPYAFLDTANLSNYSSIYVDSSFRCCSDPGPLLNAADASKVAGFVAMGGSLGVGDYAGDVFWDQTLGFTGSVGVIDKMTCIDPGVSTPKALALGFAASYNDGCFAHQIYDPVFWQGHGFAALQAMTDGRWLTMESATSVPEPTSIALLGLGLLGFAASRRKSTK